MSRRRLIIAFTTAALFSMAVRANAQATNPQSQSKASDWPGGPCPAPQYWFERPVELQWTVTDTPNPNCGFHRWSWQTFLWLMQNESLNDSSLNIDQLPYYQQAFKTGAGTFQPRHAKTNAPISTDFGESQAGTGSRALVDQTNQVVYYTVQLNKTEINWIKLYALTQEMLNKSQSNPEVGFPAGCLELKAAWRVAKYLDGSREYIPNARDFYYTVEAEVPVVTGVDKQQVVASKTRTRPALLAMVGLHIVGRTTNHPEFVWATFEHVDNAPACSDSQAGPINPLTGNRWSFYPGNVDCNCQAETQPPPKRCGCNVPTNFKFDEKAYELSPAVTVCTVNPAGGGSTSSTSAVTSLNQSVVAGLKTGDRRFASYMQYYRLAGTLWTDTAKDGEGVLPVFKSGRKYDLSRTGIDISGNPAPMTLEGSVALENTTLETYFQGSKNCFSCHSLGPNQKNNLNLSHLVPVLSD